MTPQSIAQLLDAPWFTSLAVVLLTLPYWTSGIAKLLDLGGALEEARHFGLKPAWAAVATTITVQIAGSTLLIIGCWAWLAAGVLGMFTAAATIIGHPFWRVADPMARAHARNIFLEHAGLIGGLMMAAILQEGRWTA